MKRNVFKFRPNAEVLGKRDLMAALVVEGSATITANPPDSFGDFAASRTPGQDLRGDGGLTFIQAIISVPGAALQKTEASLQAQSLIVNVEPTASDEKPGDRVSVNLEAFSFPSSFSYAINNRTGQFTSVAHFETLVTVESTGGSFELSKVLFHNDITDVTQASTQFVTTIGSSFSINVSMYAFTQLLVNPPPPFLSASVNGGTVWVQASLTTLPSSHLPDISIPNTISLDLGKGTIDVGYAIADAALTDAANLDLSWADAAGIPVGTRLNRYTIPAGTGITQSQQLPTYKLSNDQLDNIPYNATQLVGVVSGGGDSSPDNNRQYVKTPLAWEAKIPQTLTNADGTIITHQQVIDRIVQIAIDLHTNPNYIMTSMAFETENSLDPYENVTEGNVRSVGLIHLTGQGAADTLNSYAKSGGGSQYVIQLLLNSGASKQYVNSLNLPKKGQVFVGNETDKGDGNGNYSSADGNKAQDIYLKINILGQLTLIEQFLKDKLTLFSDRIGAAQRARGINPQKEVMIGNALYYAPSNLLDFYGLIFSGALITTNDATPIARTTVGAYRIAVRNRMIKGWAEFSL